MEEFQGKNVSAAAAAVAVAVALINDDCCCLVPLPLCHNSPAYSLIV